MQRRLVVGPAKADAGADEQRKDSNRREYEIEPARAGRNWREPDAQGLARLHANQRVADKVAVCRPMETLDDVALGIDRLPIDFREDVTREHTRTRRRRIRCNLLRYDAGRRGDPQDTVFRFGPRGAAVHVRRRETQHCSHRKTRRSAHTLLGVDGRFSWCRKSEN